MARTHAQQFANETLPRAVFADPLAFTRAIASDAAAQMLGALWEQAGEQMAPIERVAATGFTTKLVRRGLYVTAIIAPPAPRASGDAAAIAIIGRGDGTTRLSTLAYYVLELALDPKGTPRFTIASRTRLGERDAMWNDGPLPDPSWIADHVFELYAGRTPAPRTGMAELPGWYWWYAFGGASVVRAFNDAKGDPERFEAVCKEPILLLPEIADAAEIYLGATAAHHLRELRPYLRRSAKLASTWQAIVERLANTSTGSTAANAARALPLISEAHQHGALTRAQACELEATVRAKLAVLGIDADENYALSEQLIAAARAAERGPRLARGSAPPPIPTEDPVWKPLFLDEIDLPQCARAEEDEAFSSAEPAFLAHGGLRAGYAAWHGDDRSPMARVVDSRWVFRTAAAAAYFLRAVAPALSDGLPVLPTPQFGDDTLAFGDDTMRRSHVLVIRIGRVVARLQATEGLHAAASRHILHAAMLHPLASRIVQRARQGLAAYWLAVASPTNAVPALVHSPGYDAARLLAKYPFLAHADLPSAMTALGDAYAPAALALASFQAQLRAHRWAAYRDAMLALVRNLLDTDIGDPRVNAAHAYEIVTELRFLDPDPIWLQLDAQCRARG